MFLMLYYCGGFCLFVMDGGWGVLVDDVVWGCGGNFYFFLNIFYVLGILKFIFVVAQAGVADVYSVTRDCSVDYKWYIKKVHHWDILTNAFDLEIMNNNHGGQFKILKYLEQIRLLAF